MRPRLFFQIALLLLTLVPPCVLAQEQTQQTVTLLPSKAEGPWPCAYYLIDSNEELAALPLKEWAGVCADETDWVQGWGPFSSEQDDFLQTHWGSPRQALLLRRHFTLTAAEAEGIRAGSLSLRCSYDENPKVYLNGKLVWSASGWNDNNYASTTLSSRQRKNVREGDNVIAVSLTSGGGSGHFDLELTATITQDPTAVEEVSAKKSPAQQLYRLDGTPLPDNAKPAKGLYLQQGSKRVIL